MSRRRHLAYAAAGLAAFLALWEALSKSGLMQATLVPPPSSVPAAFVEELTSGIWLQMVGESLRHYAAGLILGSAFGVAAGVAVARMPRLEAAQAWIARVLRPIPPLAWIPFAIIWFGVSETAATFIISIGIFWINYYTALGAVQAVDRRLLELADAFGHERAWARLTKIILPASAPAILSGLRTGIGQGWMTVVAAEIFGISGIGQRMIEASGLLATNVVIVYMLTISALYGLTDFGFVLVRNRVLAWQRS